jgi:threonine synthase
VAGTGGGHGGGGVAAPLQLCRTGQIDTDNNVVAALAAHPLKVGMAYLHYEMIEDNTIS